MGKKSKTAAAAAAPPKDGGMDIDSPPKGAPAAKGSKRRARDRGDEQDDDDDDDDDDGPLGEDEDVEVCHALGRVCIAPLLRAPLADPARSHRCSTSTFRSLTRNRKTTTRSSSCCPSCWATSTPRRATSTSPA